MLCCMLSVACQLFGAATTMSLGIVWLLAPNCVPSTDCTGLVCSVLTKRARAGKAEDAGHDDESVGHGRSSHLALGLVAVLSRRKLGGCALLMLRHATADKRRSRTASDNHREQVQLPHCHCHGHGHLPIHTEARESMVEGRGMRGGAAGAGSETGLSWGRHLPVRPVYLV